MLASAKEWVVCDERVKGQISYTSRAVGGFLTALFLNNDINQWLCAGFWSASTFGSLWRVRSLWLGGGFLLVFTTCGTRFEVGLLVSDDCVDVTDKLGVALLVVQTLPYFWIYPWQMLLSSSCVFPPFLLSVKGVFSPKHGVKVLSVWKNDASRSKKQLKRLSSSPSINDLQPKRGVFKAKNYVLYLSAPTEDRIFMNIHVSVAPECRIFANIHISVVPEIMIFINMQYSFLTESIIFVNMHISFTPESMIFMNIVVSGDEFGCFFFVEVLKCGSDRCFSILEGQKGASDRCY